MSAKQRHDAETLALKYARTFAIPIATVKIDLQEGEDAKVSCPTDHNLPVWTLLPPRAAWATHHKTRTLG